MPEVKSHDALANWLSPEAQDSPLVGEFACRTYEAISRVATEHCYRYAIASFLEAFDYRSRYEWRPENRLGVRGLLSALTMSLAQYNSLGQAHVTFPCDRPQANGNGNGNGTRYTARLVEEVELAAGEFVKDHHSLKAFARALYLAGFDVGRMPPDRLAEEVARALLAYTQGKELADSSDPW